MKDNSIATFCPMKMFDKHIICRSVLVQLFRSCLVGYVNRVTTRRYASRSDIVYSELGLWYFTPLSTIFQLCHGGRFYLWKKPDYQEKTDIVYTTNPVHHLHDLLFVNLLLL